MITEEEVQESAAQYNMRLVMTQFMNRPNPLGPRRDRRRKNGGKMGVTRRASSRRLPTAEIIRHMAREVESVKRANFATDRPWEQLALTFADKYMIHEAEYGDADSWNAATASQYIRLVVAAYGLRVDLVHVYWSLEDEAFIATNGELRAHGETIEAAIRELSVVYKLSQGE